ncbi:hypothetical protein K9F62_19615 [Desulfovibrio sp. JY]|nr:hypothetical protein K9F62_19615 [Desulfovibrio sp. JY]
MKISEYSKQLKALLEQKDGCVILLNGSWGVGKTHFWNEFIKNEFNYNDAYKDGSQSNIFKKLWDYTCSSINKLCDSKSSINIVDSQSVQHNKVAYVSLFGKKDINEIQSEALVQLFTRNKLIDKYTKIANLITGKFNLGRLNLGISSNSLGILLSLIKAKELNDKYICLDDFERKCDELKIVEIIGYASILSERYACKVIIVMDEREVLKSSEGDIYKAYKEKMVDFEIKFIPDHVEIIGSILKDVSEKYKPGIIEAIKFAEINNLRTIKRIEHWIILFDNFINEKYTSEFYFEIAYDISLLVVIYFEYGKDGLGKLSKTEPIKEGHSAIKDEALVKMDSRIQHRVSLYSELDQLLWNFLDTMTIDAQAVTNIFNENKDKSERNKIRESVHEMLSRYTFDLSYSDTEYVSDIKNIFEKHMNDLIGIFSLDDLFYIIGSLLDVSKDEAYLNGLKNHVLDSYVEKCLSKIKTLDDLNNAKRNETLKTILEQNSNIKNKFEKRISLSENELKNTKNIQDMLGKIQKGAGWNPEDSAMLDSMPIDFIKESILNNHGFLEALVDFLRWRNHITGTSSFDEFCKKSKDALISLGEDKLGSFRYKRITHLLNF